jgi:hypothetical protein
MAIGPRVHRILIMVAYAIGAALSHRHPKHLFVPPFAFDNPNAIDRVALPLGSLAHYRRCESVLYEKPSCSLRAST